MAMIHYSGWAGKDIGVNFIIIFYTTGSKLGVFVAYVDILKCLELVLVIAARGEASSGKRPGIPLTCAMQNVHNVEAKKCSFRFMNTSYSVETNHI